MADGAMALPKKEKVIFGEVVRCYETKTYPKGVKLADSVLKKFPNHGETLSMKGLILGHMEGEPGKNAEGHALIKLAIKNDPTSHVVWHVYGLLHRHESNYKESIKCYKQALKCDPDNTQIWRDLSHMHIQLRDVGEYIVTRNELLKCKPNLRVNWLSIIVAQHYAGEHEKALETFERYEAAIPDASLQAEDAQLVKFESSEQVMFKAQVLHAAGKLEDALELLTQKASEVVDQVGWMTQVAKLHLQLGNKAKAASLFRRLVDKMPDNHEWHLSLRGCLNLDTKGLKSLYLELQSAHPSCEYCKRAPLDFLTGDDFSKALMAYVTVPLRKGVPSLFTELCGLYSDQDKGIRMETVFSEVADCLRSKKTFPGGNEPEKQPEQVLANALNLLSFHFDKVGNLDGALTTIDEALGLKVEPAILELHLAKAAFLKRSGDYAGAVAESQIARLADTADRYLNGTCVKRLLQNGEFLEAEKTAALFARDGDQASNLFDMQCCWFETEAGWCHLRGGRRGRALKYFHAVVKHYCDMDEDQFDFHQYCLRKMTLRAYVEMLKAEDAVYDKPRFWEAVDGLVQAYLSVHDNPPGSEAAKEEAELAKLSKEERQKIRKKQKAQKERLEKEEKEAAELEALEKKKLQEQAAKDGKKPTVKVEKPPDLDPLGDKLLNSPTPLDDALKVLTLMEKHAAHRPKLHNDLFSVFIRQGKVPLALRSVKRALALDSDNFETKRNIVHLITAIHNGSPDDKLLQMLKPGAVELMGDSSDVETFVTKMVGDVKTPIDAKFAAQACAFGGDAKKSKEMVTGLAKSLEITLTKAKTCRDVLEAFVMIDFDGGKIFRQKCAEKFPKAEAFKK